MSKLLPRRLRPLAALPILLLAACETPTPAPSSNVLAAAGLLKPVPNYSKAPCEMQREWAADNSRKASVEKGAIVVYKAPCDVDPAPVAQGGQPKAQGKSAPAASKPVAEIDPSIARRVALN